MDEQRIERLARALCRAARLDPDKPIAQSGFTIMLDQPKLGRRERNWTLFRREAERAIERQAVG